MKYGDKVEVTRGPMRGQIGKFDGHPSKPEVGEYVQTGRGLKWKTFMKSPGSDLTKVIVKFPNGKSGVLPRTQVRKVR